VSEAIPTVSQSGSTLPAYFCEEVASVVSVDANHETYGGESRGP
jgi:hypothetical protein